MQLDSRDTKSRVEYLADFAQRWGVPRALTRPEIGELADRIDPALDELGSIGHDDPTTERMVDDMRRRIALL
jgi:hypothetical protein